MGRVMGRNGRYLVTRMAIDDLKTSENGEKRRELGVFLFLTVVLAPALSVALVGGYGFAIWMSQLIVGPPGAP